MTEGAVTSCSDSRRPGARWGGGAAGGQRALGVTHHGADGGAQEGGVGVAGDYVKAGAGPQMEGNGV